MHEFLFLGISEWKYPISSTFDPRKLILKQFLSSLIGTLIFKASHIWDAMHERGGVFQKAKVSF